MGDRLQPKSAIGAMLFASRARFDFSGPKSTFDARIGQQIVLLDDSPGVVAWASELIVGMQTRINAGIAEVGGLIEA